MDKLVSFLITVPRDIERRVVSARLKELDMMLLKNDVGLVRRSTREANEFHNSSGVWEVRVTCEGLLPVAQVYAAMLDFEIVNPTETAT